MERENFDGIPCRSDAPAPSAFGSGGRVARIFYPRTIPELQKCVDVLRFQPVFLVVGGGTNLLFPDDGCNFSVVCTTEMRAMKFDGTGVYAACGARLAAIARAAEERALGGMEALAGIPGTLGGAIRMNAGAFGSEIADLVEYADILTPAGTQRHRREELAFAYRSCGLFEEAVVAGARLKLLPRPKEEISRLTELWARKRRDTQPSGRSLGSVFKRADGVSAGYYIDACGLKGTRAGGAVISEKHANFIVNTGGAASADFLKLARLAQDKVDKEWGVALEYEIRIVPRGAPGEEQWKRSQ